MPVFRVQGTVGGQTVNRVVAAGSDDEAMNKLLRVAMPLVARQTLGSQAAWVANNVNVTVTQILGLPVVGPTDFDT
jgi:hypothetical protein